MEVKQKYFITTTKYKIPEDCINQFEKELKLVKKLGKGSSGIVYNVCKIDDCKYALKIIPLKKLTNFDNEVKYSVLASELNIGPKIYSSWICDNVETKNRKIKMGFILMEKMEYTLDTYYNNKKLVKKNDKILKEMYKDLITIMLKNNISHKDLPFENIMINIDKNKDPIKMRIIDWNSAKILNSEEDTIEGYLEHWDKVINVFYKQPYD